MNIYSYLETSGGQSSNLLSCKIFEHFALQVDPVIKFIQLGSTPFQRQRQVLKYDTMILKYDTMILYDT